MNRATLERPAAPVPTRATDIPQPDERRIFFPVNLPEALAGFRSDCLERILAFYDWLAWRSVVSKSKERAFISIHRNRLRKFLGGNYKRAIERLLQAGAIERDGIYRRQGKRPGVPGKAIGYRIAEDGRLGELTSRIVTRAVLRSYKMDPCSALHPHRGIIESMQRLSLWDATPPRGLSFAQCVNWHLSADDFKGRRFWYGRDKVAGRVFHNVSNMPRELRGRLQFDGRPTAEIDLANAQPFLLASLQRDPANEERERYVDIVQNGKFYEWFMERNGESDRDAAKDAIFSQVIFAGGYYAHTPYWKLFATGFPVLAATIEEIGQRNLPSILQKAEADLFIETIVPDLLAASVPVVPIHDSLLVPEDKAEFCRVLAMRRIMDRFAICPTLTVQFGGATVQK